MIVLVGPTAVGKTSLGIDLAQAFHGEIISGDSQQIYRELAIGTAKATAEEQAAAKHHLIDQRSVTQTYSAYDFVQEAKLALDEIWQKGALPIIVGGTGLYIQSLLEGYHLGGQVDQESLLAYRAELEKESDQALFDLVAEKGLAIKQINRRRAIRTLELERFGQDLSNQDQDFDYLLLGLNDDRQIIYDRINTRVDLMVQQGLLEEAKWLYETAPDSQAAKGIGYKELFPYFEGQADLETCLEKLKQDSRRFAKRQLTWFRNRMQVHFYPISDPEFPDAIFKEVEDFLHD